MTWSTLLRSKGTYGVAIAAAALLLFSSTTLAQTVTSLFQYPGESNNTTALTNTALLAQGADGNIYSTDALDGKFGQGSVYSISPAGEFATLYSFCAEGPNCVTTGAIPVGGVTLGSDGNFYGTVRQGGAQGFGQVFRVTPEGVRTTLYNFTGANVAGGDGGSPIYPVFLTNGGNLWGVQTQTICGAVFKLTLTGKISTFPFTANACPNGANPNLPTLGSDGNFYGTTQGGGGSPCQPGCGVVYKVTPAGKITVLYKFQGTTDGAFPQGVLVQGTDGNFWGVTQQGNGVFGTIFKISPSGEFKVVHAFTGGTDGGGSVAGLTLGSDGNFYGTAEAGPDGAGEIFRVTPAGGFSILYGFVPSADGPGFGPCTVMLQHTNGKFYGSTCGNSLGGSFFYSLDVGLPSFVRTLTQSGAVGATVTFLGEDFTSATKVEFGGAPATFKVVSDTELTAIVPAAAVTGAVKVITSKGTLTATSKFKVLPTIKSINPTSGPLGTLVTVTGTGLTGATKVTVGGVAATFKAVSSTDVQVKVPTTAKTGAISITTAGGTASSAKFTVTP